MRLPAKPPSIHDLMQDISTEKLTRAGVTVRPHLRDRYLHWDELRRLDRPEGLSHEEWWLAIKLGRLFSARDLPFRDVEGRPFTFSMPDGALESLHRIDQMLAGEISTSETITNPERSKRYVVSSLIEEAITSSQLEGASTSRQVAKEMLRSGRQPRDKSERMIFNNYLVMSFVRDHQEKDLTLDLIRQLHEILTEGTLDDTKDAGRRQLPGEGRVEVWGPEGELLDTPPPADQLVDRLHALCTFANGEKTEGFLHPVVRAIVVHFWLAYDHPFVDGNGRTARALFYWPILRQGYWLAEFLTISSSLRAAPARYIRSFLYTETDERDLTHFILYQLEVIVRAIDELESYLERKTAEVVQTERLIRSSAELNHRQVALLSHAVRHPGTPYTFKSHGRSHNVVHQTARTDLLALERLGLLTRRKVGRATTFLAPEDLDERLGAL